MQLYHQISDHADIFPHIDEMKKISGRNKNSIRHSSTYNMTIEILFSRTEARKITNLICID
jgi:hypothetical protein